MVAHPDHGAGNDPEPFFFFFFFRGVGSLSQPRLNIFTVGNMRVMICLGQGGLRSLSASSYSCFGPRTFLFLTLSNFFCSKANKPLSMMMPLKYKLDLRSLENLVSHLLGQ